MWKFDTRESFLLSPLEIARVATTWQPIGTKLRGLSSKEVFDCIRDFQKAIGPEELDFSGTCASCGEMVPARDEFLTGETDLFAHDNLCTATWDSSRLRSLKDEQKKYWKRGEEATFGAEDGNKFDVTVMYQRRGNPGSVALEFRATNENLPERPKCGRDPGCPFFT